MCRMVEFRLYKTKELIPYQVWFRWDDIKRIEYKIGGTLTKIVFKDETYYYMGTPDGFLDAYKSFLRGISAIKITELEGMINLC